ncbi:MAG: DUF11 domain-containing protein, partial [Caldilineaceae bacterium]|nr:DUF11 domain-containing protein [Caldilineaceae bacterium]
LTTEGYLYTDWPIQYADQTDTLVLADGSTGYGRPSLATLAQYDLVIWAQSACNSGVQGCFIANSPTRLGADEALRHYLDQGGRLLLSGQDLGGWEDGLPLFADYLQTALVADRAAGTGSTLTGSGFLSGLQITMTNASLYGYANGSLQLAPDAVVAEAGAPTVYPILTYDDSQLPAALAIDPCNADYRAAYFAVGYENIARRGKEQDPAFSALLGRTVAWLAGARRAQDVELVVEKPLRFGAPGAAVTVPVQLINTGRQPLTLQLRFDGNQWPVSLQRAGEALPAQLQLAPCRRIDLTAVTAIPSSAVRDAGDIVTLTLEVSAVDGTPLPALTQRAEVATTVFPTWQVAPSLSTLRYQQATVALPGIPGERAGQLYAIGGWADGGDSSGGNVVAQTTNERFDSCTGQWQTLAALPAPRAAAAVATIAGDLYVVGGRAAVIGTFGSATQPFANLWRYEVAADRWQERAPLPVALSGAAAIGVGDSLYLFGGVDNGGVLRNLSYRYDGATDRWHELAPIPGPGRLFAAVAQVGEELFLVGGYPALSVVHRYDPAHNRWQAGPPLHQGRHSFGLARTPGGELYAVGGAVGDEGLASVERLVAGVWQLMPALQLPYRNGVGAAYVDGAVVAVGGAGSQGGSELLAVDPAFCRSTFSVDASVAGTGKPLLYTIQLQGDTVALPDARLHNRLPPATRFVGFVDNALNARYDATSHAIDWQGALAAHATPPAIRYQLTSDPRELTTGDRLTNTVTFAHGAALTFTRQTPVALLSTDLANSYKAVDQSRVRSGALLTYTIAIQGESYVSNTVTVRDPLPPLLTYVPDSLRYIGGRGGYDVATRSIWWEGSTATTGAPFANVQDRYLWGDNRTDFTGIGGGPVGGGAAGSFAVPYQWLSIQESGTVIGNGDDVYFCELPIGFAFPFYGKNETTFCVSTNGFLSFDPLGDAGDTTPLCPLPDRNGNRGMIAAIWDDLVVGDAIYYQTFGSAPHRSLVVQWQDVHRFGALTAQSANFQLVLMEDGQIRLAIEQVGTLRGTFSLTGVANPSRTQATTYACREPGRLYNQQAILFLPPGGTTNVAAQTIQFQAQIGGNGVAVGVNLPVTNTAYISASAPALPNGPLQRHATTLLNPLDLTSSRLGAERTEVAPQETVAFTLTLRNTGLVSAAAATAVITLPTALTVEAGSVHCVIGDCRGDGARVTWQGAVAPQANQTVHFTARLTQPQPDRTPLLVTAQINDGAG